MAKRNFITEIKEIKKRRLKRGSRWEQVTKRFYPLMDIYIEGEIDKKMLFEKIHNDDIKREIIRYIFIGLVACLEGYYRLVIRDLIDKNDKCKENIKGLSKDIKFDIDTVIAIHGNTISIGDFISHLVKLSKFDSLNNVMTTILGFKYHRTMLNLNVKKADGNIEDWKVTKDSIKYIYKTYELRDIYCHELAPKKEPIERLTKTSQHCMLAVYDLLYINEIFINNYLDGTFDNKYVVY